MSSVLWQMMIILFNLATLFREDRVKLPPVIVQIFLQRNIGSAYIGK